MQMGKRKAVRSTNSTEMPSTPILYFRPANQVWVSWNWKPARLGLKSATTKMVRAKVASVVASAIQRAAEAVPSPSLPKARIMRIPATPISGAKVVRDRRPVI